MCPIVKVLEGGGAGYIGSHAVYEMIRAGEPAKLMSSSNLAKSVLGWEPTLHPCDMISSGLAVRRQSISL